MQQRTTKLILAGMASLTVGIGAMSIQPAVSSNDHVVSVPNTDKAKTAVTELMKRAQVVALLGFAEPLKPETTITRVKTRRAEAGNARAEGMDGGSRHSRFRHSRSEHSRSRHSRSEHSRSRHGGREILLSGETRGSYFWDTGSSGNGDTGAPASGQAMQEGCFASPSWPMGTTGYVEYAGKRADFVICDRGPGAPSSSGVMLDIDGKTYADLTGGQWVEPEVVGGSGQAGNISITYHVTWWGKGPGKGEPKPF